MDYYNDVYPSIDMSLLRKYSMIHGVSSIQTGYSSNTAAMRKCLDSLHDMDCPVVIASNSPVFHVKRVLTRLGLSNLNVAAYLTPERRGGITKNEASFWDPLFDLYPKDKYICCLIDDNGLNVQVVRTLGMRALRITPKMRLPESIVHFLNILPSHPTERNDTKPEDEPWFDFDDAAYLEAKNAVDDQSFSASVRTDLVQALQRRLGDKINIINSGGQKDIVLTVVDVGAGLLNMFGHIQQIVTDAMSKLVSADGVTVRLQYIAFESNRQLFPIIEEKMFQRYGMSQLQLPDSAGLETTDSNTMVRSYHGKLTPQIEAIVHVSSADFMSNDALRTLTQLLAVSTTTATGGNSNKRRFLQTAAINGGEPTYVETKSVPVDLIVGCCVADLVPPTALAAQLLEMAGDDGSLVYLPITFAGQTKLVRTSTPNPSLSAPTVTRNDVEDSNEEISLPLPLDADVFRAYHAHLQTQGHHLYPDSRYPDGLLAALNRYGCSMLSRGDSSWNIPRSKHPHMWRCMLRFLALGTAFSHLKKWDMKGWFASLLDDRANNDSAFVASNIDLLAVFPHIHESIRTPTKRGGDDVQHVRFGAPPAEALRVTPSITTAEALLPLSYGSLLTNPSQQLLQGPANGLSRRRAVEFIGPRAVRVVEEPVPTPGRGQLLLRTLCSLVSTGTELKIFQGEIDSEQPADLSIAGMQDKMGYPLRYGYSLVGEVIAVGPDVADGEQWLGKRVFSFSPHASSVVVDTSSVLVVPPEVSSEDAVFLPSVETAVSLVQSAQPLLGDRVLVVGQGLIGLLTGAVLQQLSHVNDVTVADVSDRRLAVASSFNPSSTTWNPSTHPSSSSGKETNSVTVGSPNLFDISIEVTGNPKGLQTAIDHTGGYGKVVVGSLFSEGLSSLRLGLKFHRSGVRLITSQVSNIPPEHSGRWNKQRRFDVAWKVLEKIRPSRLLPSTTVALRSEDVLQAYLSLERGDVVTVLFRDNIID